MVCSALVVAWIAVIVTSEIGFLVPDSTIVPYTFGSPFFSFPVFANAILLPTKKAKRAIYKRITSNLKN